MKKLLLSVRLGLLATMLAAVVAAPVWALPSTAPGDIVLGPSDVGPDFVVMASGESRRFGVGWSSQSLVRGGRHGHFVEPDGIIGVASLAVVAPDPAQANQVFDLAAQGILEEAQPTSIPQLGDRSLGAVAWADGPFSISHRVVLFRVGTAVAWVVVASYEAPTDMGPVVELARIMAARASR